MIADGATRGTSASGAFDRYFRVGEAREQVRVVGQAPVASSGVPRRNGAIPAKPGTMMRKRRVMPALSAAVQIERASEIVHHRDVLGVEINLAHRRGFPHGVGTQESAGRLQRCGAARCRCRLAAAA